MGTLATTLDGATASNRYQILGRIASGGMADIYVALATTEAGVERHVVLKRVLAERARDEAFATMFLDEARLSAQLQHQNIAQVYDVGRLGGTYFYTMEYVHGEDLRHVMQALSLRRSHLPINLALCIASGALAALQHAHDAKTADGTPLNIVHRDVSPSNVMIGYHGAVKLLDFGVAKAAQRSTESQSGAIKGKVAYLSPEQIKGQPIDRRSDVFALGIVLHEMLTGKRLYKREADFVTLMAITTEDIDPPSKRRSDVSPGLERIVMTALEKDRDRRYASAAAMLDDIEALATAERHLVSASALARFMRDEIGMRPEPWIELRASAPALEHTASVSTDIKAGTGSGVGATRFANDAELTELAAQLDHARDLRPIEPHSSSDASPVARTSPAVILASPTAAPVAATPVAATMPTLEPSGGKLKIVIAAALTIGAGVAGYVLMRKDRPSAPAQVATAPGATSTTDSANAAATAPSEPPPTEPPPPPVAPPDAAPATTEPPPTVAQLGIAACNAKQRATALDHYKQASTADRKAIASACKARGISLATTPARPPTTTGKKDPCADPAYVDAHPMQCP